jgi:hypothetical protein
VNRLRTLGCNLICFAGSLPGYIRFQHAARHPRPCQRRRMRRLLHRNRATDYGREHNVTQIDSWEAFTELPLTDYDDYGKAVQQILNGAQEVLTGEPVTILQPTSGTSSSPKLIPYTAALGAEFKAALDAWLFDLYVQRPKLLGGPQYWSISPASENNVRSGEHVPVGFLDDAEYFGARRRWMMDSIMAVPSEVRMITDMQANQYVTLLFLLRETNLRLMSVWHPSFLTILLGVMRDKWPHLLRDVAHGGIAPDVNVADEIRQRLASRLRPAPRRSHELGDLALGAANICGAIWPHLQIISCWRDGQVASEIAELEGLFPGVLIQGKGLLATEGVVSIPLGPSQQHVCAVTSHILEFQDDRGVVHPLWDVTSGAVYCVILTTAGGLYRYQLRDRVEVTGMYHKTPCVRILGRAGVVSDGVGEKLHLEHVEAIVARIAAFYFKQPRFMVLVPSSHDGTRHYRLLVETGRREDAPDLAAVAAALEGELCRNYHYAHARQLGQLAAAAVIRLAPNAQARYQELMVRAGGIAGTIKCPALCTVPGMEAHVVAAPERR